MGLGPLVVGVTADASNFANAAKGEIDRAGPILSLAGDEAGKKISDGINSAVKTGMVALGVTVAAGVAAATYAIESFVSKGIELSTELQAVAGAMNINSSSLLLMKEAAASVGAEFDILKDGIQETTLKFGEALNGEASATEAFTRIGLSIADLRGMAPDQLFQTVVDKLNLLPDAAQRVASASAIMGDDVGLRVIPILNDAGAAAAMLSERWQLLGADMTDAEIASSASITGKLSIIDATFERFQMLLSSQMVPAIDVVLKMMESWITSAGGMRMAAERVANGIVDIAAFAMDAGQVIYGVGKIFQGLGQVIIAVGGNAATVFVAIEGAVKVAVGKMNEWIAGFFADTLQWARESGDGITNWFNGVMDSVSNMITEAFNTLIGGWNKVADVIGFGHIDPMTGNKSTAKVTTQAGDIETRLRNIEQTGANMASEGNDLIDAAGKAAVDNLKNFQIAFANLETGANSLTEVFTDGANKWSTAFKESVRKQQEAAAAAAAKAAGATNNNPGSNTNMNTPYSNWNANTPIYSNVSGVTIPNIVNRNTTTGATNTTPPVQITNNIASGVTSQAVKQAMKEVERNVVTTVQKKIAQGGNYRREVQC